MTRKLRLLDCTLRDGGYINDWEFGRDTLTSVFERLAGAGVDIIEVGFLDARRPFDENRSIMPDTKSATRIYGGIHKGDAIVVGMIDYGTCPIANIEPCENTVLDGIRVIFKKHLMHEALAFCAEVKKLGYRVFAQAVSITSYSDPELLELIGLVNSVCPFAMSMVDTYGLLHQSNLLHIFKVADAHLLPEIALGYHAHNNFQMGYANSISMLHADTQRDIVVDGSLYGMGKSAGNAPIELISMYMNEHCGKSYDVSQLLEAIETNILDIYRVTPWGYNFFYYVAASNKCHPNYVSYLMEKRTLSMKSIKEILSQLVGDEKLLYNQKRIEALYLDFQKNECDDADARAALFEKLQGREVLVLGPGPSIAHKQADVQAYIRQRRPVVFSINFLPRAYCETVKWLFITNAKRYAQMASRLAKVEDTIAIVATSNVTRAQGDFPYVLNYSALIDPKTEIPDNSLVMLLKALRGAGVHSVALAGFDGYRASDMNYYKTNMEYGFAKDKADYLNGYVRKYLHETKDALPVTFVTASEYEGE